MYPYLRLAKVLLLAHLRPTVEIGEQTELAMRVWPGDLDAYPEQNNGRHLTLMDLGRYDLAVRCGLYKVVKSRKWSFMIAGSSVRYRHRLRPFQSYRLCTKLLGHDGRFVYFHQITVSGGRDGQAVQAHSSALIRAAIANQRGLVSIAEAAEALGKPAWNPPLPAWVQAWIDAEALRPWPPTELG
jgi:acyl-CoA thioesterase FadM